MEADRKRDEIIPPFSSSFLLSIFFFLSLSPDRSVVYYYALIHLNAIVAAQLALPVNLRVGHLLLDHLH